MIVIVTQGCGKTALNLAYWPDSPKSMQRIWSGSRDSAPSPLHVTAGASDLRLDSR